MDDFASVQASVQDSLIATTRSVNRLVSEDLQFYRSVDPRFSSRLDKQNARLLSIAQRLLDSATENTKTVRPTFKDIDDVDENWGQVVDVVDSLLERAGTALDELTGAVKRLAPDVMSTSIRPRQNAVNSGASWRTEVTEKPQLSFDVKTDNHPTGPFRPLLTSKPHALAALSFDKIVDEATGRDYIAQPYKAEIEQYSYPSTLYTTHEPIEYTSFAESAATLVDSEEAMDAMIEELKSASIIAVDLEHHDQRSYIGIVCLMQISTRDHDWIVDTLLPWRRKLEKLNQIFANPSIVKVLHGAYMDVIWLQRDLGIYMVGLFDTYHAARALGYPGASYAYLLKTFTNVDAQKQYQMADWRIRPLPQELVDYARSDTHYLLYIFDNMRNELIAKSDLEAPNHEKDKIHDVQERSREVALQRYEYPIYDYEKGQGLNNWYKLISKTSVMFNPEQFAVFRAVHQWRDNVAREQDDSIAFVMPNHVIFNLARNMPMLKPELLHTAQPLTSTVRLRADELLAVIVKAREEGKTGPQMMDILQQIEPDTAKQLMSQTVADEKRSFDGLARYLPGAVSKTASAVASKVIAALPIRNLSSLFWGSTLTKPDASRQQQRQQTTRIIALEMTLPLPPLTAEIFAEAPTLEESTDEMIETTNLPDHHAQEEVEEDVFILKELGRKRKLAHVDAQDKLAGQLDTVALPGEHEERLREKSERKRLRKEAKRAAKGLAEAAAQTNGSKNPEPFDYASAPSVLDQPMQHLPTNHKGKKQVNPYAKVLDAPRGLSRSQKEKSGKSMSYLS